MVVCGELAYGKNPLWCEATSVIRGYSADNPLIHLGVPCRPIYDRSMGGRVVDPVLPLHPLSQGRSDAISPIAELQDLTPHVLRPMDGRWIAAYRNDGQVSPAEIFRGWTDEALAIFPHFPERLRVIASQFDLS